MLSFGKIALQPLHYTAKICAAKILVAKVSMAKMIIAKYPES